MTVEQLLHQGFNVALEWVDEAVEIELSHNKIEQVVAYSIPKDEYTTHGTPLLHRILKEMYNDILS